MDPRSGVKDYVRLPVFHLSSRTEVEGALLYGGGFAAFLEEGILVPSVFQSSVIPLISGEWIVSHVWHEILRLSPHLFWLGLSHIERFRPLRMTIRGGGWTLIWEICCVFWN